MLEPGALRVRRTGGQSCEAMHKSLKRPSPLCAARVPDARARIHVRLARGTLIFLRQFFQFRSHKANRRYTRGTHNVYDPGDNLKLQGAIPPNESRMIGPGPKNLLQRAA